MRSVNIHEAKTHLSRLIEVVQQGESFVIAKSGRPVARVSPISAPAAAGKRRLGFLSGELTLPADFDAMGQSEIAALFDGPA